MKKIIALCIVVVIMISLVPISASAVTPRAYSILPGLTFNGTTATCSLTVYANANDSIDAVIKLWQGSTCLKTWTEEDIQSMIFVDTATVSRYVTYKLTVDVSINGIAQPQHSVTRTNN